jgi:hypothetical protein
MRVLLMLPVLAACSTAPPVAGPVPHDARTVSAGDPWLDGSFLTPYESRWRVRVDLGDGKARDDAEWTDKLEAVTDGDHRLMRRTQHESESLADAEVHPEAKKLGVDHLELTMINTFDPRTLAPVETTFATNVGRALRLRFDGAHVTGAKTGFRPEPIGVDDRLEATPFDFFDGMYGYVAVAMPREEHLHARLAVYRAPRGTDARGALGWVDVHELAEEAIIAGSLGRRPARVFDVQDGDGGSFRFWVAREAPFVLRVVQREPGQTWDYELE